MVTEDGEAAAAAAAAMERLGEAVIATIKSGGTVLPTIESSIPSSSSSGSENGTGTIQWTQYVPAASRYTAVLSELHTSITAIQERFGPSFDVSTAFDVNGRPLLYAGCLGLCLSDRRRRSSSSNTSCIGVEAGDDTCNDEAATTAATPLNTFLPILHYLLHDLQCPPTQPSFTPGCNRRPPIHLLARSCYVEAVSALLDSGGADPLQSDEEGWTALMATCMASGGGDDDGEDRGPTMEERVDTARLLLDYQPDGDDCVDNDDSVDDSVDYSSDDDDDGYIVLSNSKNNVAAAGISNHNYQGRTALHLACEGLMAPMVELLLQRGADPRQRTWVGESPLGIVAWNEDRDRTAAAALCRRYLTAALDASCEDGGGTYSDFREEEKAVALIKLVDKKLIPLANSESTDAASRDHLLLTTIMKTVGMDPDVILGQEIRTNWYEDLHRRVSKLLPRAYTKVYSSSKEPTEEEYDLITSHDGHAKDEAEFYIPADEDDPEAGGARRIDVGLLRREAFVPYRERGLCARNMDNILKLLVNPIKHSVAFAIPSDAILDRLANLTPKIVEVGAGTGYWSAVLRLQGVDVVSYDSNPPSFYDGGTKNTTDSSNDAGNVFFSSNSAYTEVIQGEGRSVFQSDEGRHLAADRALLLVWPNNSDHIDNPHLYKESSSPAPPVWDADCLTAYVEAGGETVIYVGEREENIELDDQATGPDCGFCSSRRFQQLLKDKFVLEEQLSCPCWWLKEDDLTIWRRKCGARGL